MRSRAAFVSILVALAPSVVSCGGPERPLAAVASAPSSTARADEAAEAPSALATASAASAAPSTPPAREAPALPPVELVQIDPSPPPARSPSIGVVSPGKDQVIPAARAAGFAVKLRSAGWDLAPGGNHLCVSIDRHPCKRVVDLAAPLTLKDLDPTIDEGQHVISVLARRGSNESVKPAGKSEAFASISFFVGKRVTPVWKDGGAMLFLNVPEDGPAPADGLVIDAYAANVDWGAGRHRVHASVGGPGIEAGTGVSTSKLAPFRLRGARPGEYTVRFSLHRLDAALGPSASHTTVSYESRPVPGPFAEITRTFRVTAGKPR